MSTTSKDFHRLGYYPRGSTEWLAFHCPFTSNYQTLEISGGGILCHSTNGPRTLIITECISSFTVSGFWLNSKAVPSTTQVGTTCENLSCDTIHVYRDTEQSTVDHSLVGCLDSFGLGFKVTGVVMTPPPAVTVLTSMVTITMMPNDAISTASTNQEESNERTSGLDRRNTIIAASVGSIGGVSLLILILIIGFRLGKRRAVQNDGDNGRGGSLKRYISSIPHPRLTWVRSTADKALNEQPDLVNTDDRAVKDDIKPHELPNWQGGAGAELPQAPIEINGESMKAHTG